jgi:hypothetical protein
MPPVASRRGRCRSPAAAQRAVNHFIAFKRAPGR